MSNGFDTKELTNYEKQLVNLAKNKMPNESKKFMKQQGNKLTKKNKKAYQSKGIDEKTGNLKKGFKTGKVYKFNGSLSIRSFNSSPHAHLLDKGFVWKPHKRVAKGQKKIQTGDEKFIPGFNFMDEARRAFESGYYEDAQEFIDDMLDKGL